MYKKALLSLAISTVLVACGNDNDVPDNQRGSVSIAGADGAPSVGETLTAVVTDPDGVIDSSVLYAWYADGSVIEGATSSSFSVTDAQVGQQLHVVVNYLGGNSVRESQTSAATDAVPVSVNVAATFMHGLVDGASCSVYAITEAGAKGAAIAAASTMAGNVDFGQLEYQGAALIECDGGTYVDEATGDTFTAPLTRAVINVAEVAQFVVSPLTELAVQLAEADDAGLNTALSTYNALVAATFGLEVSDGAGGTQAIDITTQVPTDLQATAALNDAAGVYATAIALMSQLDENTSGDAAAVVAELRADLADGSLSVASIQRMATAKSDLATSAVAANLNQAALDAISAIIGLINTPGSVAIAGSPSVGSTITAQVTDGNGVGSVSYQWYLDGAPIDGATAVTYTLEGNALGARVTVTASYTDNAGFSEMLTSAETAAVTTDAVNIVGSLAPISGTLTVGSELSIAAPTDANGVSGSVSYQWQADGVDIANANANGYTLTDSEVGAQISVQVSYTDDDGFDENLSASATDVVYSAIVAGKDALAAAVAGAVDGALIGLAAGDYTDMPELDLSVTGLTLKNITGSTATISGDTCIQVGSNVTLDGLIFDDLAVLAGSSCASNGPSSIYLTGTNTVLRNSQFLGERRVSAISEQHYVSVKGFQALIERNIFRGKDIDKAGAYISIYANSSPDSNEAHTLQYNYFKDAVGASGVTNNRSSSAYAIQVGRSTGSDGKEDGLNTIQYNLFDNVQTERRLIKVQSSGNTIHGNTVLNSLGSIALEDGYGSTVSSNIIVSAGDDGDDGAISFAPLGHTIIDNFIGNIRTTSSQRGGLLLTPDPLSGSGNGAILANGSLDFTVTVARNTVVNARQAFIYDYRDCTLLDPIVDFDSNLIANQSEANSIYGNSNGEGRVAVTDSAFVGAGCSLDASSDFDNNHFYSSALSDSGGFNFNGKLNLDGNLAGAEDGATLTAPNANGLVEGSGSDVNIGADIDALIYISTDMVGPGSTWRVSSN